MVNEWVWFIDWMQLRLSVLNKQGATLTYICKAYVSFLWDACKLISNGPADMLYLVSDETRKGLNNFHVTNFAYLFLFSSG